MTTAGLVGAIACAIGLVVSLAIALLRWQARRELADVEVAVPTLAGNTTMIAQPRHALRRVSSELGFEPTQRAGEDGPGVERTELLPQSH